MPITPELLLKPASRTICVALEIERTRSEPSAVSCMPTVLAVRTSQMFETAGREHLVGTASQTFVPAACHRKKKKPEVPHPMQCAVPRSRRRIPLGRASLLSWFPVTVHTMPTCISRVIHRSRTVFNPHAFLCGCAGRSPRPPSSSTLRPPGIPMSRHHSGIGRRSRRAGVHHARTCRTIAVSGAAVTEAGAAEELC